MATYYWVGGTGTWDSTTTTHWATSSGGAGSAGVPTSTDSVIIDTSSGTGTITCTSNSAVCLNITVTATQAIVLAGSLIIRGNLTFPSSGSFTCSAAIIFASTSASPTVSTNGITLTGTVTFNAAYAYVYTFGSALTTTSTFAITQGNLSLNGYSITCNALTLSSNQSGIDFGTGAINVTSSGTAISLAASGSFTSSGSQNINLTYSGAAAITVSCSGFSTTNALNINITAGTYSLSINANAIFKNLNFTGFTGTWSSSSAYTLYGNLTISSGMTYTATGTATFAATSGSQIITSNGKSFTNSITQSGAGGTVAINGNLTLGSALTYTLTNGTLDLTNSGAGNYTLSTGIFSSSNTNTRAITFGTGNITLTGNATTIWLCATLTGFTYTGTPTVNCSYSGSTSTRTIQHGNTAGGSETVAVSFNITAGSDTVSFSATSFILGLVTTGFSGTIASSPLNIYGSLTIGASTTFAAGSPTWTFGSTVSGQQNITTNGVTVPRTLTFSGTQTYQLQSALTTSTALTYTSGTLDFNSKTVTIKSLSSSSTLTRSLLASNANIYLTGSGAVWGGVSTNLSTTFTGSTIYITDATSTTKTFNGLGKTYNNLALAGSGGAIYTILSSNTFNTISNTDTSAFTLTLTASTTTTVSNFNINGNATNQATLNSSTSGTKANLSQASGTVNANYLTIQDSNATGGATWNALASNGCVNNGNNLGWFFGIFIVAMVESLIASDAFSGSITAPESVFETITAQETIIETLSIPTLFIDSVSAQDQLSESSFISQSIADNISALDSVSELETSFLTIAEAINAVDSQSESAVLPNTIAETITPTSLASEITTSLLSISESISPLDSLSEIIVAYLSFADSVSAIDIFNNNITANLSTLEVTSATDLQSELTTKFISMMESAAALDSNVCTIYAVAIVNEVGNAIDTYICAPIFFSSEKVWHLLPRANYWHTTERVDFWHILPRQTYWRPNE